MKKIASAFVFILYLLVSPTVIAEESKDINLQKSFVNGNKYSKLNEGEKYLYVIGFLDGLDISRVFGASEIKYKELRTCITNMTINQLVAILDKYLQENPEILHQDFHVTVYNALIADLCKILP